jgi:hypothetical protein
MIKEEILREITGKPSEFDIRDAITAKMSELEDAISPRRKKQIEDEIEKLRDALYNEMGRDNRHDGRNWAKRGLDDMPDSLR